MSESILVTGGGGFLGFRLLERLAASGGRITGWHRPGHPPSERIADVSWMEVDICDKREVERAIRAVLPTQVFHCAGMADPKKANKDREGAVDVNAGGTRNLLDAIVSNKTATRVLIPSSAYVYKDSQFVLTEESPVDDLRRVRPQQADAGTSCARRRIL